MKKFLFGLGLSLSAHIAGIIAIFYFSISLPKTQKSHYASLKVDLVNQEKAASHLNFQSSQTPHQNGQNLQGKIKFKPKEKIGIQNLFQLSPVNPLRPLEFSGALSKQSIISPTGSLKYGPILEKTFATGAPQLIDAMSSSQWLSALYLRIDANLNYPLELAKAGIEGGAQVEISYDLEFPDKLEISSIKASSPYLRVIVMHSLKRSLNNLSSDLRKSSENQNIKLHFSFEITEPHSQATVQDKKLRMGRTFVFYRNHVMSKLQWEMGPFSGLFGLPSVGINPNWFAKNYDHYIKGHTQTDPLDKFRRDPEFIRDDS